MIYGPLADAVDETSTLEPDPLSVGGRAFVRVGSVDCELGVTCSVPSVSPGICDSSLEQENADVIFAPLPFSITDPDGIDNSNFVFSILSGDEDNYFRIDSASGGLNLIRELDRDEGPSSFTLVIQVSDGLFTDAFRVDITIGDTNDNPPVPTEDPIVASVDEGAAAAMVAVNFTFTDIDEGVNANITYSLVGEGGNFNIPDSTIGAIYRARDFDYEAGDRFFNFTIIATDGGSPSLSGSARVEITINDLNDNLPTINAEDNAVTFVEGGDPVFPATVTVSDADSFSMLYAVVRIDDALNAEDEILALNTSLPSGFRIGYYNNTLIIVGAANTAIYGTMLSEVAYGNIAVLFETPLERSITYGVCDQLSDNTVLSMVSSDTSLALTSTSALDAFLPVEDFELLIDSCRELVVDNVTVALEDTNDRPMLLTNVTIEFPSVTEDTAPESSMGSCVGDLFSQAIVDVDREPFVGIAVVGHGSPAQGQVGIVDSSNECRFMYNQIRPLNRCGARSQNPICECNVGYSLLCDVNPTRTLVAFKCVQGNSLLRSCVCSIPPNSGRRKRQTMSSDVTVLPEFSDIVQAQLFPGVGAPIDFTPLYTTGSFTGQFESYQQQCNILSSNGSYYSFTFTNGSTVEISTPPINHVYVNIANVNESSAIVVAPTSFIRWIPFENQVGTAYLFYKAWDGSNGLASGTTGVDTTDPRDTSFSVEIGNATVEVLAVNDAPVIELGGPGQMNYTTTYVEGGSSVFIAHRNASVIEFDSSDLTLFDLRVSISALGGSCDLPNYNGVSNDRLSYFNDTELQLTYSMSQTGQACMDYTFEGELSVNQWQAFITMIRFRVEDEEPSDHTREISFTIRDSLVDSSPSYAFVNLRLVSDICPVLTLPGSSPVIHTEHGGPTLLDGSIILIDADRDPLIGSARVAIVPSRNNPCDACELAATTGSTGISASFNSTTLVLTLSGAATPDAYQQVLRTVTFEDIGLEPSFDMVDVRFSVFDPTVSPCTTAMGDLTVSVEHVNDNSPELFLNFFDMEQDYAAIFTEGNGPVRVTGMEVRIMDADGRESDTYRVEIEIQQGCIPTQDRLAFRDGHTASTLSVAYDSTSCSLTLEGSRSGLQTDLQQLQYNNLNVDNPTPTQRILNFTIIDGDLESTFSQTILTVVPVNDAPVIDLDVQNVLSSDAMVTIRVGTTRMSIVPQGASIVDPDSNNLVGMVLTLTEMDSALNEVSPRSDIVFESILASDTAILSSFGLTYSYTSNSNAGIFSVSGTTSVANYVTVLNDLLYFNSRIPPTENRRQISVQVTDGVDTSEQAFSIIMFSGQINPPLLDLNGNEPGVNTQETYVITTTPITLFPNAFLTDVDEDNICRVNVTLTGPNSTCGASSLTFDSAFSDIIVNVDEAVGGVVYSLTTSFDQCREALVFQAVIRGITFSTPDSALPGMCEISIITTDFRTSNSNIARGVVEVRAFNAAPFIDLDLGLFGRDYSTVYFQGGRLQHIVSIFDPATARNITEMTVVGEADGEAPFDDGTIYHGVVIREESNAGYTLVDVDSPTLEYLQVSKALVMFFFFSSLLLF